MDASCVSVSRFSCSSADSIVWRRTMDDTPTLVTFVYEFSTSTNTTAFASPIMGTSNAKVHKMTSGFVKNRTGHGNTYLSNQLYNRFTASPLLSIVYHIRVSSPTRREHRRTNIDGLLVYRHHPVSVELHPLSRGPVRFYQKTLAKLSSPEIHH